MTPNKSVSLRSSLKLPPIGFGTWLLPPAECARAVSTAIDIGFRHIDTAPFYGNEEQVGMGIAASKVPRDELIIATKVWVDSLDYDKAIKSTIASLRKLRLKMVDLLYVHWPAVTYKPSETFRAFSKLVDDGLVHYVGVANFTPKLLDEAIKVCDKPIVANQIEHHPFLQQLDMRDYLKKRDMYLVAYSPLARGEVMASPELQRIAKRHGATPGQVALAWSMNHGAVPIPKATSTSHIKENFEAQRLKLEKSDIEAINSIKVVKRLMNMPGLSPNW
jgi:2,5-diketo-D-gluconate reductase B